MKYIDVKTASNRWELTERRITALCRDGRIEGAKKERGLWLIPDRAEKPKDGRRNKFSRAVKKNGYLPLPVGVSNFKELIDKYYYVDKTLMLKEFMDTCPKVSLFTRPRRFGKTLTMDMIKTFFEFSDKDTSRYFKNKKIWSCGEAYRREQGKYPVIFVTFKDIKYQTWEQSYTAIREIIASEYLRHDILLTSKKCNDYEKEYFRKVVDGSVSEVSMARAFLELSRMLQKHYNQSAIIIIDEYDTPIQQGYTAGYYEQITGFMRNLLSGAFKDNANLAYGFLTGILRVAKESIFSGLNNLAIHSILDEKYSEYFGFTADEVREMTEYYGVSEKYDDICEWYDGYRFGNQDIFNPWSVINYFYHNCFPKAYWQATGDNSIIRRIVAEADDETADNLRKLMQGQTVSSYIDTSVIYPEIKSNPTTIYSFLLAAGYLKTISKEDLHDGNSICDIAIPNREIFYVYEKEILSSLSNAIAPSTAIAIGRYDIQLRPYNKKLPGIMIELKVLGEKIAEDRIPEELEKSAREALEQMERKQYVSAMRQEGLSKFFKIGAAFYKKHVKLISQTES